MKPSYILFSSSCPRLCFIPVFATFRSSGTETDECKNTLSVSVTEPRHDSRTIRYQPPLMSLLPVFSFFLFLFFFFFRFSKRRSSLLAFYSWNVCPLLFRNRAWFTVSPLLATRLFLSLRYEQRFRQRRVGLGTSQRSSGARKRVQREKKILEPANLCGRWGKKYRDTKQDRSVLSRAESFVDTNRVSRDKPVSFQPAPPLCSSESRKTILRPNFSSRLEDIQFYRVINSIVNS